MQENQGQIQQVYPDRIKSEMPESNGQWFLVTYKDKPGFETWLEVQNIGPKFQQLFAQYKNSCGQQEKQYSQLDPLIKSHKKNELKEILNIAIDDMYGDLEYGDKPKQILKVRRKNDELEFLIEWLDRENKVKPQNSIVTNTELKKFCPDILMTFYENKMIFKNKTY